MDKEIEKLSIISQNFQGYIDRKNNKKQDRLKINENNKQIVTDYLKRYKADIIAGQELPAYINEENYLKCKKLDGTFDGKVEGDSDFFTGFYVNNKKYVNGLIPNNKISKIWSDLFKCCPNVPSFRSGYWCEKWIKFCGKRIRIINIHVSQTYDIAIRLSLLKYLSQIYNKYTIILGDFNAAKIEQTMKPIQANDIFLKTIEAKNYYELISEMERDSGKCDYTHFESSGGRKLDHIFVSKALHDEFKYKVEYIHEVNKSHPDYNSDALAIAFTDHSGIEVSFWECHIV